MASVEEEAIEKTRVMLTAIGKDVEKRLPRFGMYAVLVWPSGHIERCNYVSSAPRPEMIAMLKEFLSAVESSSIIKAPHL